MQIVLSYGMLLDLNSDSSRMFDQRMVKASSTLDHLREQKYVEYLLLNGHDKLMEDHNQSPPILYLKKLQRIYKAPSDIQNEALWPFEKTGRILIFNECEYEFNANKNSSSHRIYCNPYDDIQVIEFLKPLKDVHHLEGRFDDKLSDNDYCLEKTNLLVYADPYVFGSNFTTHYELSEAAREMAKLAFKVLEVPISCLLDYKRSDIQLLILCLDKLKMSKAYKLVFENNQSENIFLECFEKEFKSNLVNSSGLLFKCYLGKFHDRFIISDYFLIRSTNTIQFDDSSVNFQGVLHNISEYYKGAKHITSYFRKRNPHDIPEFSRLYCSSLVFNKRI